MNNYFLCVIYAGMLGHNIPAIQASDLKSSTQQIPGLGILNCFHACVERNRIAKQADLARSTTQTKNDIMLAQLELLCIFERIIVHPFMSEEQKDACAKQLHI